MQVVGVFKTFNAECYDMENY